MLNEYKDFSGRDVITIKRNDHLFSLTKTSDGILIKEECDGYHKELFSKEDVIEILDQLREWVINSDKE